MASSAGDSTDEFRTWLTERVAFYLDQPAESIDPAVELAEYGMDSIYALSVISDIEDRLGMELDVGEVRQYRTVDALADYLGQFGAARTEPAPEPEPARTAGDV
ncbi:acyl carrier protein [Streptomyces boncukensis]|uniref:Acyl carrier protein n=1 Tax=Streptomyces boncukensis TaxID=2711219 RepID=A0A6G4WPD0_9ACTN|nr:acyl carrier protein [Streptomyces boncukensis]NGO66948.1 acyl carrier protein [Streptomyces boncukensis]